MGRWPAGGLQKLVGYVPQGLIKLSGLWDAPLPDYSFKVGRQGAVPFEFGLHCFCIVGIVIIAGIVFLLAKY